MHLSHQSVSKWDNLLTVDLVTDKLLPLAKTWLRGGDTFINVDSADVAALKEGQKWCLHQHCII